MRTRRRQRGYLFVTVVITLFLFASIAVLLSQDSAISANTSNRELEAARAEYVARAGLQHALWRAQNNVCMGDVTIPDTALGADTYSASITGAAAGSMVTLSVDQDAWIRSDDVSRNNGTSTWNHVRNETAGTEQVLTRFDVSSISANAQISSAVAWFHLKALKPHPEGSITIHEVTAGWTETGVTWESFAGAYRNSAIGMIPAQDTGDVWVAINLTAQVQAWVNGQPNYGILFNPQADGTHTEYTAREDGTNPPRLEVVVGSGTASPVTIKAKGELDTGVVRKSKDKVALAYQPQGTVTLQLGADPGADAMLDSFYPRNYGASDYIQVNADPGFTQHPVLRFGMGGVPTGARVVSATLEMRMLSLSIAGTATAHQLTRSFVEGTKAGGGTADGVTWGTYDGTNNWTTAGGDFDPVAVDAATITSGDTWVAWDVSALVQSWLDGKPNYGLLLKGADGLDKAKFASREAADSTTRPKLTITYACECGSACMAPRGSGNVLMVVEEKTWLGPDDEYLESLLEGWGYTVTLISDHDNQNTYDNGIGANDVVFVSETVDISKVGTKLNAASIGIVNSDGWLNDELGFESGKSSNWPVGDSIKVNDTSHYIAAPFAAGNVAIYNASMGGLAIGGTPAAGVQSLADWAGSPTLAVLEAGATTAGGGTAAGRRVMLPFGQDASIDWTRVNNNGHVILQRSLDWAMNSQGGLRILLVVGISGSLSTRDTGRRDLFESWGHTVTIIDDGAILADFVAEFALNDIVYVAGSVVDGALVSKLTKSTLGIVNEIGGQLDDLGFHGNAFANTVVTNQFTATDAAHYISKPFAGAGVTHFTTNLTMPVASAPMAPYLGTVAATGTLTWAIPVLDTGAQRWDSEPSAGRRVHLPFRAAEISQLTADGVTLLRRSLEWAGGAGCDSGPQLLFAVSDPGSPTAQESARRTLFESWCYNVALIDDSDSQANFDTAAGDADVAYISAEVSASTLGTKLKNSWIGIVSEDPDLHNDYGFSTVRYSGSTNAPLTTDDSHYITTPFSGGDVTLFTATQPAGAAVGTLPSGLATIGTWSSGDLAPLGGLLTLEMGAEISGGGFAAGRRVQTPWQGQEGGAIADIAALSTDGKTILQRSLEWAAGAGCDSRTPLLFVVSDSGSPTAGETARRNVVESWCYDVTLIDDGDSQASFDAAVANNNVAYISADAAASAVGTKLTDSGLGIVNEQIGLHDDLGFSSDTGSNDFDKVFVEDNTHDISTGYSTGWLTTLTSSQVLNSLEGTVAPGLRNLMQVWISGANYKNGLAVIETGGSLYAGGSAAGRRVQLPWGPGFDFNALNSNGLTIMRRALDWAAGALLNQTVLLVVDDASSLNSKESAVKALMESWGNAVTTISANASQANFNLALADVDVAYISGSISSSDLGAKLKATTVGVVSEDAGTMDDMGVAEPVYVKRNTQFIDIIDNTHYMTSGLSIGSLAIVSSSIDIWTANGTLAPGLQVLGETSVSGTGYPPGVAIMDAGAALYGGGTAAGRRVQVPWSQGSSTFDLSMLTTDGLDIMQRAIEWGAGAGSGGGGGGGGGGPAPVFEEFTDASASSNETSLDVSKPGGTAAGDLLIAALATDGDSAPSFTPPAGWTQVSVGTSANTKVSLGVWWKIATSSEPSQYNFTWSGGEEAYGWISRFTGHDPSSPILYDNGTLTNDSTSTPICQKLITPVDDMLVLRLGGFDDDDVTIGDPGLAGHTAINMDESGGGNGTVSGGSGYLIQATAGDTGFGYFALTNNEEMRTVTLGIRPAP